MSKMKSFRGLIADGNQDTISLHTNTGSVGYKIKKLQVLSQSPTTKAPEAILKVYSVEQTSVDATVDFSDQTLLGVAFLKHGSTNTTYDTEIIIFDNTTFNQDIYITSIDASDNSAMNYYLELEQFALDLNENTVATLKDIRNIKSQ
jgi:hypothetical protein